MDVHSDKSAIFFRAISSGCGPKKTADRDHSPAILSHVDWSAKNGHAICWDFPGGGREGQDSGADCALRELHREYGPILPQERLIWRRDYPSHHVPGGRAVARPRDPAHADRDLGSGV